MTEPEEPTERTDGPHAPDRPLGRSHYEDFDLSATPQAVGGEPSTDPDAHGCGDRAGRSPVCCRCSRSFLFDVGGTAAIALGVLGVLELAAAALVAMLHPLGRPIGIALGCVGLVLGLVSARSSPANGLVTMGLNGFVIYALASSGPAFRRG